MSLPDIVLYEIFYYTHLKTLNIASLISRHISVVLNTGELKTNHYQKYLGFRIQNKYILHCLSLAIENGILPVVKYIVEHYNITLNDLEHKAVEHVISRNHLCVTKYMCEHFNLTLQQLLSFDSCILCYTVERGKKRVIKYIFNRFSNITFDQLKLRDTYISLKRLKLICNYFNFTKKDTPILKVLFQVCCTFDIQHVKYLTRRYDFIIAEFKNNIDALVSCKSKVKFMNYICKQFKKEDIKRLFLEQDDNILALIDYNRYDVIRYIHKHIVNLNEMVLDKHECLDNAYSMGCYKIGKYLLKHVIYTKEIITDYNNRTLKRFVGNLRFWFEGNVIQFKNICTRFNLMVEDIIAYNNTLLLHVAHNNDIIIFKFIIKHFDISILHLKHVWDELRYNTEMYVSTDCYRKRMVEYLKIKITKRY